MKKEFKGYKEEIKLFDIWKYGTWLEKFGSSGTEYIPEIEFIIKKDIN